MQQVAEREGFRRIFLGWPDVARPILRSIRFRPSTGSYHGRRRTKLLDRTEEMVCACMPSVPVFENPGVLLGTIVAVGARDFGRDKMTIVSSPGIVRLGAWLEQLVAESTGKDGKGVIPIDGEPLGEADVYSPIACLYI